MQWRLDDIARTTGKGQSETGKLRTAPAQIIPASEGLVREQVNTLALI